MARIPFNAIIGAPKAYGITVVVVALDNIGSMTWSLAGQSGTVTLSKWCDDRPPIPSGPRAGQTWAGWIGSFSISGLSLKGLEQKTGTITQNGVTLPIAFRAQPSKGQKFTVVKTTCFDKPSIPYSVSADIFNSEDPESPNAFAINNDDLSYVDNRILDDLAGTGHLSTGAPQTTNLLYDFGIAWMYRLGLIGEGMQDEDIWYFSKLNHLFQPGNHEAVTVSSGRTTWDNLFAHCKGDGFDTPRLAVTDCWQRSFGDYKFVCTSSTDIANNTDHVLDVLDELGTVEAFKFNLMARPGPWNAMSAAPVPRFVAGHQRLFYASGQTPPSISDNVKTNGGAGIVLNLNADRHNGWFVKYFAPADTGIVQEKFAIWNCGGTTSAGHIDGSTWELIGGIWVRVDNYDEGTITDNAQVIYKVRLNPNAGIAAYDDPRGPQFAWTRITCHGDEFPPRVTMEHRRQAANEGAVYSAFTRHWTVFKTDNYGSAVPVRMPRAAMSHQMVEA